MTGIAANCWLALMDRLLTPGVSQSEKDSIRIKMLELVDIYYWALDARKRNKVIFNPGPICFIDEPSFLLFNFPYYATSKWYVINH